jgi:DNA-binding NarL/FixJ family response regulator
MIADWVRQAEGFKLVAEFPDPVSGLERIRALRPDVVLSDINMPGMTGIECVRQLKPALPSTQFVMLTVYGDTDHIYDALAAGASGYLLKSTPRDELIAAVREVYEGGSPMTSDVARKVVQSFRKPASAESEPLSSRERSVLELLAAGHAYKEIADQLSISVTTVNTYIRRIYEKLHVHSRAQAVAKYFLNSSS